MSKWMPMILMTPLFALGLYLNPYADHPVSVQAMGAGMRVVIVGAGLLSVVAFLTGIRLAMRTDQAGPSLELRKP